VSRAGADIHSVRGQMDWNHLGMVCLTNILAGLPQNVLRGKLILVGTLYGMSLWKWKRYDCS
jgi:hypothetical protein